MQKLCIGQQHPSGSIPPHPVAGLQSTIGPGWQHITISGMNGEIFEETFRWANPICLYRLAISPGHT